MTDYCTVTDVVAQLRLTNPDTSRKVLDETTDPKASEVTGEIQEHMAFIDRYCLDAWRETASELQFIDVQRHYMGWTCWENGVGLRDIGLFTLDKSKGDVLSIRSGNQWIDLLDGAHTEGVGGDYWLDYQQGILYLGRQLPFYSPSQIKLQYRYGHPELGAVPLDIKHACIKLAAAELLDGEFYAISLGSGEGFSTNRGRTASKWTEDAMLLLSQHKRAYIPLR